MKMKVCSGLILIFAYLLICTNLMAQNEDDNSPVDVNVSYTADALYNTLGGINQGFRYTDNIDINLKINFGDLPANLNGTTLYIYGLGNQESSISSLTGDLQGVSNIDSENSWRIFEVWAQKKFFLTNSSLLVGLYDINSEFNVLSSSLLFMNSSHGLDPTIALSGVTGPSTFPYTSLGMRLKINPWGGVVFQTAILDGVPSDPGNTGGTKIKLQDSDGAFVIGELSWHSLKQNDMQSRNRISRLQHILAREVESDNMLGIGGWFYSRKRQKIGTNNDESYEYGFYAISDYKFAEWANSSANIFVRTGFANGEISRLKSFYGAGIVFTNLISSSSKSGLAVARAVASSYNLNFNMINGLPPASAETNIELTHIFSMNEFLQVQFNSQYIINPSFNSSLSNALTAGVRFIVGF